MAGVELCLEPAHAVAALVAHGEQESLRLAEVGVALEPERWHELEFALVGDTTSASLDGVALPELSLTLDDAPATGRLGLRVLGEGVSMRTLALGAGEEAPRELVPAPTQTPAELALESLVLLLFNLNEFVYVD